MRCRWKYYTPDGFDDIIMESDGEYLTKLFFDNCFKSSSDEKILYDNFLSVFSETCKWLDIYFSKRQPDFTPKYKIYGLTTFQEKVIEVLESIPFGHVLTYGDVAFKVANALKKEKMSAQAIGGALGSNPISILIPCHRVIGKNLNLTGYAGGIKNKIALLANEQSDVAKYRFSKVRNFIEDQYENY